VQNRKQNNDALERFWVLLFPDHLPRFSVRAAGSNPGFELSRSPEKSAANANRLRDVAHRVPCAKGPEFDAEHRGRFGGGKQQGLGWVAIVHYSDFGFARAFIHAVTPFCADSIRLVIDAPYLCSYCVCQECDAFPPKIFPNAAHCHGSNFLEPNDFQQNRAPAKILLAKSASFASIRMYSTWATCP
jgi:hypothetical protein